MCPGHLLEKPKLKSWTFEKWIRNGSFLSSKYENEFIFEADRNLNNQCTNRLISVRSQRSQESEEGLWRILEQNNDICQVLGLVLVCLLLSSPLKNVIALWDHSHLCYAALSKQLQVQSTGHSTQLWCPPSLLKSCFTLTTETVLSLELKISWIAQQPLTVKTDVTFCLFLYTHSPLL